MNKFICIALAVFAFIASGSCGGYGNLAQLALDNSYNNPASSSAASAASAPNSHASNAYGSPINAYSAPAPALAAPSVYSAPAQQVRSNGPRYAVQPAYASELYPGPINYKAYHSPATYSQVALPIVPDSPVAKLYVPDDAASYAAPGHGSAAY